MATISGDLSSLSGLDGRLSSEKIEGNLSGGKSTTGSLSSLGSLNGGLSAGKLDGGLSIGRYFYSNVLVATRAVWDSDPNFIGNKNTVYVYSDYYTDEHGNGIPAFKVGDGLAYLIDLPTSDSAFEVHAANTIVHITDEERAFWNNKVSVYLDIENMENLIFTTN